MKRFLCWLGWHPTPPGLNRDWCIAFHCNTCGAIVPGGFSTRRK